MTGATGQLQFVRMAYPSAQIWEEGAQPFVFLPKLQFETRVGKVRRDVLICPHEHSGYPTRLFLDQRIEGTGANFNSEAVIGGRNWYAASWGGVPASLPWLEILAAHLKAYQ